MKITKFFLTFTLLFTLILAAGCKESISENGETDIATRLNQSKIQNIKNDIKKTEEENAVLYTLLVNNTETCDIESYKALATTNAEGDATLAKEINLITYTLLNQFMTEENIAKLDVNPAECLVTAFPRTDKIALQSMRQLIKDDMEVMFEERGYDQIVFDIPTNCEELKTLVEEKFDSESAEIAYENCLAKQDQSESSEQDEKETYDSTNATCNIDPMVKSCSPSMSATEYTKYAMNYITPNNAKVQEVASQYNDIESLYKFMQKNHWQSDTTLFGCDDYFETPEQFLKDSPTFSTNMICEDNTGDCDDQGNTFASLIIASGLYPEDHVRVALGTVKFGRGPMAIGGHLWTEVWTGEFWMPIDATYGDVCYDDGTCYTYENDELGTYDYYKYAEFPVLEYWGVANHKYYYSFENGEGTAPDYWQEGAKTVYDL
ncbi:hypothetical protein A2335_00255 [Candidatus Peregrinibacteria bacterium RIFOXYB2_FULL_32_7]|nr:MAG: hypothetical protein A2335_00255 [Candidatus Peregrinibacteria bacterium RIFOXYB2_FULL_32_7]